jgi:hypothetical protein
MDAKPAGAKEGPTFLATARFDAKDSAIETALAAFGAKYSEEWSKWEPRFRKGLADGSRVLVRYRPSGVAWRMWQPSGARRARR